MPVHNSVKLYTDGGSKGNPGKSAIGIVITLPGHRILTTHAEVIEDGTNNEAEYKALAKGLDLCRQYTAGLVECYSDSEVVVRQMNGTYKTKFEHLKRLKRKVNHMVVRFDQVNFSHVPRTDQMIMEADRLLNEVRDAAA